jgi:hypothetical protein
MSGPGWNVQRAAAFGAHSNGVVLRIGDVIAVRSP